MDKLMLGSTKFKYTFEGGCGSFAVASLIVLSLALPVSAQNPFNDNQQWAQPPGTFLNSKAVKKPAVAVRKPVAKVAPLKQNVQRGPQNLSGSSPGAAQSGNTGDQFQQTQRPMGQSEWQQMGGTGSEQQQSSQQGSSDWVGQPNQQAGGQGWVTNTQAPAEYGQSSSSSGSGGQLGSSGWIIPGGSGGGNVNNMGINNSSGQNQANGAFSSQGVGNFQPQQQTQQGNVQQSQWNTPGGSNGSMGNGSMSNNANAGTGGGGGTGQSQWNTPGNNSSSNFNNNSASQSTPGFPPSSFSPGGQQVGAQAPLLGDVLEKEQLSGNAQSGGVNVNTNSMNMGGGQAMPAFSQGSAAGFMPGLMNLMQNIMPARGGGFNPNLNTGVPGTVGGGNGSSMGSGNGSGVFIRQQQPQQRQAAHKPLKPPRIITQTGRQVSRQLNRSVNNMIYRGIGNLRF